MEKHIVFETYSNDCVTLDVPLHMIQTLLLEIAKARNSGPNTGGKGTIDANE